MGQKLYVGGLPYATKEQVLKDVFAQHGTVVSASPSAIRRARKTERTL